MSPAYTPARFVAPIPPSPPRRQRPPDPGHLAGRYPFLLYKRPGGLRRPVKLVTVWGASGAKIIVENFGGMRRNMADPMLGYPNLAPLKFRRAPWCSAVSLFLFGSFVFPRLRHWGVGNGGSRAPEILAKSGGISQKMADSRSGYPDF